MDSVNCPFCKFEKDDLWDEFRADDGDEAEKEIVCEGCGKKYTLIRHIHVYYSTEPDADLEDYYNRHPEAKERLEQLKASDDESNSCKYIEIPEWCPLDDVDL